MDDPRDALRQEAADRGWQTEDGDAWVKSSADGSEQGIVRLVGDEVEARVVRHPTGPSPGPDPEPSHGPQVFPTVTGALDYAEGNLGADAGDDGGSESPASGIVGPGADAPAVPEPNEPA